ncbi:MAG: tripartite tricarboxylate transporter TctB family protein [Syntrophales bacterium]|nr:tripartite tricarboxylate transporter TctB family protein [Syntrophales bacterium]
MKKADYLTGLALILLGVYVLVESWRMPRLEHLQAHPLSVPGIVPAFLAVVLLIFGLILVGRSVKAGGHHLGLSREGIRNTLADPGNRRLLWTAVLTVVYAGVLVGRIPYGPATGLFIFVFVVAFEWSRGMSFRDWKRLGLAAATLAIVFAAAVSYTFERLFLVTLP